MMTPLEETGGAKAWRWGVGLAAALVLHGGIVAPFYLVSASFPAEPAGEVMVIDMSLLMTSPQVANQEPAVEESAPVEDPPEEVVPEESPPEEVKEEDPPLEPEPSPEAEPNPEPPPEVVPEVPLPEPKPELPPPPPKVKSKATVPKERPSVQKAVDKPKPKSAPSIEAPESETVATQALGKQVQPNKQRMVSWETHLGALIKQELRYPSSAQRRGREGRPLVLFRLDATGKVMWAKLLEPAGSEAINEEAVDLFRRISRFPPPPTGEPWEGAIRVVFEMRR
ncbi:MAG: TonB family protein [Rhodospirillum sp.]|nr:TonB family protein [Rhodospirillum sp.]MCF8488535.1 TonB family protein [Rhodospirillum sp.]MCF8499280.1 TonB family protein [Rhodospirillum sp.]